MSETFLQHIRHSRLHDTYKTARKRSEKNISGSQTLAAFFSSLTFLVKLQQIPVRPHATK